MRAPPPASRPPVAGRPDGRVLLLLAAIVLVAVDVFRIGYFADDFIFLDAARRHGLIDLLSGRFGILP